MNQSDPLFTDGEAYERFMGRWSRMAGEAFIDWLAAPVGVSWLDVGCGNGAFTEALIARCAPVAVAGLDPSEDQLAYARARTGARMADFRLGDAQELPFAANTFDAATMALVIAFIRDPAKAAAEMARVVRPGGWVAAYMWDMGGGGTPVSPMYAAMKSIGLTVTLPPSPDAARLDAMRDLWLQAGLESIEVRMFRIPVRFSDFEELWASTSLPVGPQGILIQDMSSTTRQALRERLRAQVPVAADGSISYEALANAVKGRVPE